MSVFSFVVRLAAAAGVAVTISATASAAVYPPQRQLPSQVITDFKASPKTLLQQYQGGPQLISRVRDLGASDPTTLPGLIALLADPATTKDQMRAIVAGLAQVARMAATSDAAYANEIQTAIANTKNADVIAAYQAATGDVAIAATGGGGGGSGAGGPTGSTGSAGGGTGGASAFGGLHSATVGSGTLTGSVSSAASTVSPR